MRRSISAMQDRALRRRKRQERALLPANVKNGPLARECKNGPPARARVCLVASSSAAPLVEVAGLTVERGGRIVLNDLGFALAPGETLLVAGRDGAGKSTLAAHARRPAADPQAGRDRPSRSPDEEVRGVETVHYLGYEDALKPALSVAREPGVLGRAC